MQICICFAHVKVFMANGAELGIIWKMVQALKGHQKKTWVAGRGIRVCVLEVDKTADTPNPPEPSQGKENLTRCGLNLRPPD